MLKIRVKNRSRQQNYLVNDLLEVYLNGRFGVVGVFSRMMNEFAQFVQSHPFRSLSENEQKTFNGVGFS